MEARHPRLVMTAIHGADSHEADPEKDPKYEREELAGGDHPFHHFFHKFRQAENPEDGRDAFMGMLHTFHLPSEGGVAEPATRKPSLLDGFKK